MTTEAIHEDAADGEGTTGALSIEGAADAFLKRFETQNQDATAPSKSGTDEKRKDTATEEADESSRETSEDDAENTEDPDDEVSTDDADDEATKESSKEKPGTNPVSDDTIVEVTVDGETKRASVRELKRLFGQEAALTRKSQEVADTRKLVDEQRTKYAAALDKMVQRAREAFKPYENIDYLQAQTRMSPEDFAALRRDAQNSFETAKFLEGELDAFIKETHSQAQSDLQKRAKEAITVLSDSTNQHGIPGWNNALYDEIRTYSIGQGMAPEIVNTIVDPAAIKLIWKAMRYDTAQKEARNKVVRKVNAPQKIIKTQARDDQEQSVSSRRDALTAMKRSGGNLESAADAFLAFDSRRGG